MVRNLCLTLALTSLLATTGCTPRFTNSLSTDTQSNDHIVGGTVVSSSEPLAGNVVGLYAKNLVTGTIEICTGSLLPNNLVLTAAHCASDLNGTVDIVIVFAQNIDLRGFSISQTRRVDKKVIARWWGSPGHEFVNTGDVALLHYQGETPKGYTPVTLLNDASAISDGSQLVLAGFGATKVDKKPIDVNTYPNLIGAIQDGAVICENSYDLKGCMEVSMDGVGPLRKTKVTVNEAVYSNSEFSINQDRGTGSCHGDSGGPAFVVRGGRYFLVGISNRTINDIYSDCSHQAVYTSIAFYSNWINAATKKILGVSEQVK